MADFQHAPPTALRDPHLGLTAYGCERDEADAFHELAPGLGIAATTTSESLSVATAVAAQGNRYVSVGHTSEVSGASLRALHEAGVDYISTRSIGFDHIDLDVATELRITVENVVYSPDGVADFTLMLILMTIRNAPEVVLTPDRGDLAPDTFRGRDLRDMTVGVLGAGNIGNAVIRRLQGFGCRILVCTNGRTDATGVDFVSREVLLRESDIVTLHVPLNPETHHLIGRAQLNTMKHGAFLINTGRGALVDTDALIMALESRRLGGAGLDVLEGEDEVYALDHETSGSDPQFQLFHRRLQRLHQIPTAIVTPHTAYRTTRTLHELVDTTLRQCLIFERNRANEQAQDRDPLRRMLGGA